jgi:hypothetical protein
LPDSLINAYLQTHYTVNGFTEPIRIGLISGEVESILLGNGQKSWAYLTSDNPLSVPLEESQNRQRREILRKDLAGYLVIDGEGRDVLGEWPPEKSYFVVGISLEGAIEIGRRFGQRAIVTGKLSEPAQLLEILDADGNLCLTYHTRSK